MSLRGSAAIQGHAAEKVRSYTGVRQDILQMIAGLPRRVLDVGCSNGAIGSALQQRGCEVTGVEIDSAFAAAARGRLDRVIEGDALAVTADLISNGERFDAIICADSLEHMPDPSAVLSNVSRLMTPDGQCIVSLPNARFWTTFWHLGVRGTWPRKERGVHDRTHLHWFTEQDARVLLAQNGLAPEATLRMYRLSDLPEARVNRAARRAACGPLRPFLTYQFIFRSRLETPRRSAAG